MKYVTKDDWYEIRLATVLSDYDRRLLTILYQPLIGYTSLAIYFTLWSEYDQMDGQGLKNHNHLFDFMQITSGEFLKARMRLEAIGLLQTLMHSENNINFYTYVLKAPKYPHDFFEDPLFAGLYEKYVGVKEAERMARLFCMKDKEEAYDNQDISASFIEIFHPNLDDEMFLKARTLSHGTKSSRVVGDVRSEFDFGSFFKAMKEKYGFTERVLKAKERQEIERIATLFGFDGERMAEVVNRTYTRDDNGKAYFQLELLKKYCQDEIKFPSFDGNKHSIGSKSEISSDSLLAKKIQLMESVSPYDYLSIRQEYKEVVSSDLNLLDQLSSKLGLPYSVINALVDYVLETNDFKLPSSLTLKIGASLTRAKINNALDAMNYLRKSHYKTSSRSYASSSEPKDNSLKTSQDEDQSTDLEIKEIEELLSKV